MDNSRADSPTPKRKVRILAENDYHIPEIAPPNFFPWFRCVEAWERLPEDPIESEN